MTEKSYPFRSAPASGFLKVRPGLGGPDLRLAWLELLTRYRWDCFATLTYDPRRRVGLGSPSGWKVTRDVSTWMSRWMGDCAVNRGWARWEDDRGGQRLRGWYWNRVREGRDASVWALGIEAHRSGALHGHVLIKFPACFGKVDRSEGWKLWFEWHGRADLEPPRSQAHVSEYVLKYVLKDGSELVLSSSFRASTLSLACSAG